MKKLLALLAQLLPVPARVWNPKQCPLGVNIANCRPSIPSQSRLFGKPGFLDLTLLPASPPVLGQDNRLRGVGGSGSRSLPPEVKLHLDPPRDPCLDLGSPRGTSRTDDPDFSSAGAAECGLSVHPAGDTRLDLALRSLQGLWTRTKSWMPAPCTACHAVSFPERK